MQRIKTVLFGYSRRQVKQALQLQQYRYDQAVQEAQEQIRALQEERKQLKERLAAYEAREAGIAGAMIAAAEHAEDLLREGREKLLQEREVQEKRMQTLQCRRIRAGKHLQELLEHICQCERFFEEELRALSQDLQP